MYTVYKIRLISRINMDALTVENELREAVSRIVSQVELASKQGRLDINLAMEDAFIPILKELFHLQKLHNLNAKQKNYPGIDLGDEYDRVAFQVTATTDLEKVKKEYKILKDALNSSVELTDKIKNFLVKSLELFSKSLTLI